MTTNNRAAAVHSNSVFNFDQIRRIFEEVRAEKPDVPLRDQINLTHERVHQRATVSGAFINLKGKTVEYKRDTIVQALRGNWNATGKAGFTQVADPLIPTHRRTPPPPEADAPTIADNEELVALVQLISEAAGKNLALTTEIARFLHAEGRAADTDIIGEEAYREHVRTQLGMIDTKLANHGNTLNAIHELVKAFREGVATTNSRLTEFATAMFAGASGPTKTELARLKWLKR